MTAQNYSKPMNTNPTIENQGSAPSAPSAPVAADPDDEEDPGEDIDNFPTARRTVPTSNHA